MFVEKRIRHIYRRPLMYGGTAEGVDLLLHYYHELWAEINQREDDFEKATSVQRSKDGCGSLGFTFHYRRNRPDAQDEETVKYVVEQWQMISAMLSLPDRPRRMSLD